MKIMGLRTRVSRVWARIRQRATRWWENFMTGGSAKFR